MDIEAVFIVGMIIVGLPWVILHYITKWKTAATITQDDEVLLDELYQLARRLDERMDVVERLVALDMPEGSAKQVLPDLDSDNQRLAEIERYIMANKGAKK